MDLSTATLTSLSSGLRSGDFTSAELLESLAAEISSHNESIGAYLSYDLEHSLELAKSSDTSLPLGGLPIGIKANINVLNQPTSCGSKYLEGAYNSPYDATATARLKAAGAVPFGQLNMDEFAMGSTTENSALAKTVNPWNHGHVPGGSSGGSAAAVASGMAIAALGSDTGGSIRQPAAHCGVTGIKPSYGRVSRYGLVAFASSLDQIGPITRNVEDAALILNAISGYDPADSTSLDHQAPDYTALLGRDIKGMKFGLPKEYFADGIDPSVREAVDRAAKQFESLGAELVEISLPNTEHAVATYYIIAPAEASSNLSRFDGIRYGNRVTPDGANIEQLNRASREAGFGSEVKRRIILGTYVLSSGYYDAYYTRAQKVRTLIRRDFERAFEQCDLILSPISPSAAPKLGSYQNDPLKGYLADIFTLGANLAGLPALSIPCGFEENAGGNLPIGLQLIGPSLSEDRLLQAGSVFQASTDWHLQRPTKATS